MAKHLGLDLPINDPIRHAQALVTISIKVTTDCANAKKTVGWVGFHPAQQTVLYHMRGAIQVAAALSGGA